MDGIYIVFVTLFFLFLRLYLWKEIEIYYDLWYLIFIYKYIIIFTIILLNRDCSLVYFTRKSKSGNFNIKTFDKIKRKSSTVREGVIKKVTSPIDDSYFFYHANTISKEKGIFEISFEFYPPSHLLIKYSNSQYSDLVCWNN